MALDASSDTPMFALTMIPNIVVALIFADIVTPVVVVVCLRYLLLASLLTEKSISSLFWWRTKGLASATADIVIYPNWRPSVILPILSSQTSQLMKNTVTISLLSVFAMVAYSQDPVRLSPQYYRVLLENDEVRVLEYRLKPGQKEVMHSHPRGFVYYFNDTRLKITSPEGKTEESVFTMGQTIWREPVMHAVENVGTTEVHALALELKIPTK
jgi:beta-alanine degradation protein BauB